MYALKISRLIPSILFILMIALFGRFERLRILGPLNEIFIIIAFGIVGLIFIWKFARNQLIERNVFYLIVCITSLMLWYIVLQIISGFSPASVSRTIYIFIIAITLFTLAASSNNVQFDSRRPFLAIIYFMSWSILLVLFLFFTDITGQRGINQNGVGMLAFSIIIIGVFFGLHKYYSKIFTLYLIVSLFFVIGVASRGALLALIIFGFSYFFYRTIIRNRLIYWGVFLLSALHVTTWVYLLSFSHDNEHLQALNILSLDLFGARIFSGRDFLWPAILEVLRNHPITGLGPSASLLGILDTGLSAHNGFLQIGLQAGYVGIFLITGALLFVWRGLYMQPDSMTRRVSIAFFVAFVSYNIFDAALTQNQFAFALLFWAMMGLALGKSKRGSSS